MDYRDQTYLDKITLLLNRLGQEHPAYIDVCRCEQRLSDAIHQSGYGSTETIRNERSQVIEELNKISLEYVGCKFVDLSQPENSPPIQAIQKEEQQPAEDFLMLARRHCTTTRETAQEIRERIGGPDLFLPEQCQKLKNTFVLFDSPYSQSNIDNLNAHMCLMKLNEYIAKVRDLLDEFCSECYTATSRRRQKIRRELQNLIDSVDQTTGKPPFEPPRE